MKISNYVLVFLLLMLSISGLLGGFSLITSPDGSKLAMPTTYLANTPFQDYLIPGIILFLLMGILPLITVYGIVSHKKSTVFDFLNIYKDKHWSYAYSLYVGIILIFWIDFQIAFMGYLIPIQIVCAILGVLIVIAALLPGNIEYARIDIHSRKNKIFVGWTRIDHLFE